MKSANFFNEKIHLDTMKRDEYQKFYEEGKKGSLSCPVCREKVRMYLGIAGEPHFFHVLDQNKNCTDPPMPDNSQKSVQDDEYIEKNGFRIPISRSIKTASTETKPVIMKKAKHLKSDQPFEPAPLFSADMDSNYLEKLLRAGFRLDKSQAEAVAYSDGPLLVLAGAGSGKTRVLTARTAFMLQERKVDPRSVMLVTFTAKAALEMKTRLTHYPNITQAQVTPLVTGTFHSIFYRILSFHSREKWNSKNLLKTWQQEQIIKEAGRAIHLNEKEFSYDLALQKISNWKNHLTLPETVKPEDDWEESTAFLYKQYEQYKQNHQHFDFDDMLIGCFQLFQSDDSILETYQNRFQYFLIDEFQDVNKVQFELIKLLSAKSKNVCAVGDDDQAIYSFRGSDPSYLLQFERDFPETRLVVLDQNYRSSHEIVSIANQIISQNKRRRLKKMTAQYTHKETPICFYPYDEEEEATMILTDMQEKIAIGKNPGDFAVLFRTNTGSRAIFERLVHSSLPFKIDQDIESFYDRFIVKGMLAFLRLCVNEDDQDALKTVLPALFIKHTAFQDIKAESILKDCSMLESLSQLKTAYAFQSRKLQKLVPVLRSLLQVSPAQAIETIEKELGFSDFVKKRGNEGNQLDKGADDIRELKVAAKNFTSLPDFLEHTDHMKAMNKEIKLLSKKNHDAVTLSTIHRAKGLEYDTVYVLGAVDGIIPHDYALDSLRNGDSQALEEERRLLYVAVTRAKQSLYLSIPQRTRGKKAHPTRFLSRIK